MDELSEEQKQCLQLFYYEDMKIKDISKALNVPEGTVKTRLKRGKSKFEEIAKEYEKKVINSLDFRFSRFSSVLHFQIFKFRICRMKNLLHLHLLLPVH